MYPWHAAASDTCRVNGLGLASSFFFASCINEKDRKKETAAVIITVVMHRTAAFCATPIDGSEPMPTIMSGWRNSSKHRLITAIIAATIGTGNLWTG